MLACRPRACTGSSVCEHDEGRGEWAWQAGSRGSVASIQAPRRPCLRSGWLVVAVLLLVAVPLAHSKTVSITSVAQPGTVTLAAALSDPQVSRAELLADVALDELGWERQVLVNRSVTVTAAPGVSAVLDFNFLRGKVVLGSAARVTITGITLRNTRKTPGFGIEIFSGSSSPANSTRHAEVWLVDLLRIRLFCPSSNITLASLSSYPRPDGYGSGGQDNELVQRTCYRDECFEESVRSQDFVTTVQPLDSEDTAYLSPYVMVQRNVTRACKFRVADTCVQQLGTDECVLGALDNYIRKAQQGGRHSGANPAAIAAAVGTAAGASCVIAALVLWLWRRRRAARAAAAVAAKVADLEAGPDGLGSAGFKHSSNNSRGYVCLSSPLLGVVCGKSSATWQVVAVQSAAEFQGKAMPNEVKLGVLQGAGSFGRVYAGEWAGMHVAVKVLQHTGASSHPVLNEVHLMLSFSHPNVVKGYHYICWGRGGDPAKEAVKPADSASSVQAQGHGAAAVSAGDNAPVSCSSAVANSQGVLVTGQAPWSDTQPLGQVHPVGRDQANSPEQNWCPPETAEGHTVEYHPMTSSSNCSNTPTAMERPQQRSGSCRVDDMMEAWLIQEYCDEGTLLEAADQWRAAGADEFMRRLLVRLREVASGMGYLHSRNVVHGDLKGNNILLCKSTSGPYGVSAKVSDFGLSRALETGASFWQTQTVGTVTHAAPEQLKTGKLTPAGDVYAYGILMWELYTGHTAFGGLPVAEVIQRVALQDERPPVPEDMPEDYKLLMSSCWSCNPGDRPSFASVLRCIQLMLDTLIEGLPAEAFGGLEGSPLVADL